MALVPAAQAQHNVTGFVIDSTLEPRPVVGAQVMIRGEARIVVTDADGRFDLGSRPRTSGGFVLTAWYAGLDTLGLEALVREVPSSWDGTPVTLSTPTLAALHVQHCGRSADSDERSVLMGLIRNRIGAPSPGLEVTATWQELRLDRAVLARTVLATADTSNANGFFALCGVPVGEYVGVVALGPDAEVGERRVTIGAGANWIRLVAAAPTERREVAGRVVNARTSVALEAAEVSLGGIASALTDSLGRFLIVAPSASADVEVRALGYQPFRVAIPDKLEEETWEIPLEPVTALDTIRIVERPLTRWQEEFEERRKTGMGRFVTDSMLRRLPRVTPQALGSLVPLVVASGTAVKIRGSMGICDPRVFEDGADLGQMIDATERQELLRLLERAKRIEIYAASFAPPRFNDFDGCGSLVIWTR
ncbi:MAG: hypothetical protein KF689_09965 [Gemmatimonadaceae bacterium]|nr:hypothetical protein [Gemmatimonadaceae bacterium]MCW5826075.1 hypothetical protein [Gemmatimonadaceae bacterium]